jgi:LmbE family N-acetylglucosaminyl deacetylase
MTSSPNGTTHRLTKPPQDVTSLGTILGVWAHPDDEAYLSGGLMAAARDAGQRVVCVTATRGERGTSDPVTWPPDRLGELRETELRASLAALGVHEHRFLGVDDGRCASEPSATAVERVAAIVEEVRPDTIVTFGPDGFTGHQDHQVVSDWVTAARAQAAPVANLLYASTTAATLDAWQDLYDELEIFRVAGLPLRRSPAEIDLEVRLDGASADRKLASLRAQTSQTAALIEHLGEERFRAWCSVESFVRAETVPAGRWGTWLPA